MSRVIANIFFGAVVLLGASLVGEERFPVPSEEAVAEESGLIRKRGIEEVMGLSCKRFGQFLVDRYWQGESHDFHLYGVNPEFLTVEQARKPAIIFLHASQSNQGQWIPMLQSIQNHNGSCLDMSHHLGATFTFNYEEETAIQDLIYKIEEIKELYLNAGVDEVELYLVGHSLGAITAAEYTFEPDLWVEGTQVERMISIAGRLRNIEPPIDTPLYAYCYDVLPKVDHVWEKIEENRGIAALYTIAAGKDWLIPQESVLVADSPDHQALIPDKGHLLVAFSRATRSLVIEWLGN